jgi:hypothetical protein
VVDVTLAGLRRLGQITLMAHIDNMEDETLKNNQQDMQLVKGKNGGARPGAGRPKGKLSKLNEQRQKAKKRFIERVNKMVDELFNAQATIATGTTYLFRVDKDDKGHDKPAVIETDPKMIKDYIDGKLDDPDSYYYITTERPDNRALDSMLNRAFGKPEEKIDITSDGKRIQQPAVISTIAPRHAVPETDPTESD